MAKTEPYDDKDRSQSSHILTKGHFHQQVSSKQEFLNSHQEAKPGKKVKSSASPQPEPGTRNREAKVL